MNMNTTNATEELSIPNWSKYEYQQTTEPYEWLYQYRDNKFMLSLLREQIKIKAADVGVKCFIAYWKAYIETINKANKNDPLTVTEYDDQPIELYCEKYTCNDSGVSYLNQFGSVVIVCRHPIYPVRRLVNIDTGEVKLEIAFKRGKKWSFVIIEKSILASSQKIIELSSIGIAVDSENAKDLVSFITLMESENFEKMGETRCVGRLGWIDGCGFSPYVENLHFDGDRQYAEMYEAVKAKGDFEEWLKTIKEIRLSKSPANIYIAAAFASALIEPLGCLPFIVHIWGETGTSKTVGLMVAASVWANPDHQGSFIKTLNTTAVGMEMVAGFLNSLPLCLDEFQMIKDGRNFEKDIYMLTEGIGKMRGAKTGGLQRMVTWRNCTLISGETPITNPASGGGAVNRIIEVNIGGNKLFKEDDPILYSIRNNYGFAGKMFIDYVSKNREKVIEIYEKYESGFLLGKSTDKQAMAAAVLMTADKVIDDLIFKDGMTISVSALTGYLKSKEEVDVNKRALLFFYDLRASNPVRFRTVDNTGEVWGGDGNGYIYMIKTQFDEKMREKGFNSESFLSWAKSQGILDCDNGRMTKIKRLGGSDTVARCVAIKQKQEEEEGDLDF